MINKCISSVVLLLGSLTLNVTAHAENANIESGKQLFTTCISCHGAKAEGNPQLSSPALAGQYAWYLEKQLTDFQTGKRAADPKDVLGQQMVPMAKLLTSAQQVKDVSAYLASLATVEATTDKTPASRTASNKYNAVCGACHGKYGEGNAQLKAPNLKILSAKYLTQQLNNYKANVRGYHSDDKLGKQMKMMANTLSSEQDIADVVAFIKGQ